MKTKEEVVEYIKTLQGYEGYVQFSHRPIDRSKDIFVDGKEVDIKDEEGFIYEAHFYNGVESIQIRQINNGWLVSKTPIENISGVDIQSYLSNIEEFNYKIKMAQIWESKNDPLCENMPVLKLQKVVFAGFEKGEEQ